MSHPDAITPEGWHIGAGFAEFLHGGVGHGRLTCAYCDEPCATEYHQQCHDDEVEREREFEDNRREWLLAQDYPNHWRNR